MQEKQRHNPNTPKESFPDQDPVPDDRDPAPSVLYVDPVEERYPYSSVVKAKAWAEVGA